MLLSCDLDLWCIDLHCINDEAMHRGVLGRLSSMVYGEYLGDFRVEPIEGLSG